MRTRCGGHALRLPGNGWTGQRLNCAAVGARAGRPSPAARLAVYRDCDIAHRTGDGVRTVASVQVDPQSSPSARAVADDTNAVGLTDPHRFNDPDEARATLAIRD